MSRAFRAGAQLGQALMVRLGASWSARRAAQARQEGETRRPAGPSHAPVDPRPDQAAPAAGPRTAEQGRLARFLDRFCHYRGDYARQWARVGPDGQHEYGWARVGKSQPDRCALTPEVVQAHLSGRITAGTYLLDEHGDCRLLVLDHDDKRTLPEIDPTTAGAHPQRRVVPEDGLRLLQDCRQRLAEQGIASAISESRRGGHLFVFLDEPVPARDARALAMLALGPDEVERMARGEEAFEIYPKQDQRGGATRSRDGAVGSNIALPLGVHLKDGQRHPFIDRHGESVAPTLSGQLDYLETVARCPVRAVLRDREWLYEALDRAMHPQRPRNATRIPEHVRGDETPTLLRRAYERSPWAPPAPGAAAPLRPGQGEGVPSGRPGLIARWKEGVDCRDVVQALGVELNATGVGQCPFHDDQHPSFQVWADGWRCHAEGRGGDALSFICEYKDMTPREALAFARQHFPVAGLEVDVVQPGGRG